jgi:hypothetical protein
MDEADHPMKSFVRAVLVVAGMYGRRQNPGDAAMSECEAKPIPKWVLEEVVSSSSSSSSAPADGGAAAVDHRLLFDLVNEALPGAVRASTTLFGFDKCYAMAPRRAPVEVHARVARAAQRQNDGELCLRGRADRP